MSEVVKLAIVDHCAVITIDAPPVNALSAAVRRGIFDSVKAGNADAAVQAIVIVCAGRLSSQAPILPNSASRRSDPR